MHRFSTFLYLISICASDRILADCFRPEFLCLIAIVVKEISALRLIAWETFSAIPDSNPKRSREWDTSARIDTNVIRRRVSCHSKAWIVKNYKFHMKTF